MPDAALHVLDHLPGVAFVPVSIERLRHQTELHGQIAGEVLRLGLPALLVPQLQQGSLVAAHNDPSVGAADEASAVVAFGRNPCSLERKGHDALQVSCSRISSAALRMPPTASAEKSM